MLIYNISSLEILLAEIYRFYYGSPNYHFFLMVDDVSKIGLPVHLQLDNIKWTEEEPWGAHGVGPPTFGLYFGSNS